MTHKIDAQNLDVIVIGAGPAGGSTARELAKRGKKVLIIERSQEVGEPNFSTAGTPKETIEEFDLPESVLAAEWRKISFATPRVETVWEFPETRGYVFDFAGLKKFLVEDAAKYGAEVMVGTTVKEFIESGENITGVRYRGVLGEGEARAKIIVDATGHNEFGNYALKVNKVDNEHYFDAIEYQMSGLPEKLHDTMAFYFSSEYAPRGYAWVFPMNNNESGKVGSGYLGSAPEGKTVQDIQNNFLSKLPDVFAHMEPTEIHAGAGRMDGGVKEHVYKNVMLVGDSAHQVNPLLAEGIRHSLKAGRIAAETIDNTLRNSKVNQKEFKKNYESAWKNEFFVKWQISRVLCDLLYKKFTDEQFDEFIHTLKGFSAQDMFEIGSKYNPTPLLKHPAMMMFLSKFGADVIKGLSHNR